MLRFDVDFYDVCCCCFFVDNDNKKSITIFFNFFADGNLKKNHSSHSFIHFTTAVLLFYLFLLLLFCVVVDDGLNFFMLTILLPFSWSREIQTQRVRKRGDEATLILCKRKTIYALIIIIMCSIV